MTLRDLYNLTAAARGHWVLCGSAERIADTLQLWFEEHAADGFNVMPPYFHEGFEDFVELVVPILQERGLFRRRLPGHHAARSSRPASTEECPILDRRRAFLTNHHQPAMPCSRPAQCR